MKKPRNNTESDATENNTESDATENNTESDATEKNTESDATVSLDLDDRTMVVDRLKVPPEHWPLPVAGRTPLPTGARIQAPLVSAGAGGAFASVPEDGCNYPAGDGPSMVPTSRKAQMSGTSSP